ncbi:hypothetical protein ACHAXA_004333 [Cyclostephanos tholiformis]|uniref:Uncharacterized protein n=1 Tax=Cyclostephanos tholiformis TaxID=382380 RepID=A0ABD3SQ45_9STRA
MENEAARNESGAVVTDNGASNMARETALVEGLSPFDTDDRAGDDDEVVREDEAKPKSSYYGLHWPFTNASTTNGSVDDNFVEETPYEHNFAPGDHIIRWDMLPIIWPIQIHGIVLKVSEDKSEVTICDFGITSVKTDDKDKKKVNRRDGLKILEEENAEFNKAVQNQYLSVNHGEQSGLGLLGDATTELEASRRKTTKNQRLNVIKLTKWSDLRKWSKVNYEGGLLSGKSGGGIGKGLENLGRQTEKGLENLGKQTEKLWLSMVKPFAKDDGIKKHDKKLWKSIRYEVNDMGYCSNHNEIQLKKKADDGHWVIVRKKCPECIKEDCPAMLGEEFPTAKAHLVKLTPSFSSTESEHSRENSTEATFPPVKLEELQHSCFVESKAKVSENDERSELAVKEPGSVLEPKTLSQMIADANEIETRSMASSRSLTSEPAVIKRKSWHGFLVKSFTDIFTQKKGVDHPTESTTSLLSTAEKQDKAEDVEQEATDSPDQKPLPRSDPPVLVLARTRFILEHGESVLPPYHILNSNSECIAVWCKTGRWSTFQASVFLHSSAIGYGKSAIGLTIGAAATQPWLIPAFATVGFAAVGTPWLLLKVANDKWNEATNDLTEKFWMQAEPEVFVECIKKWGNIE